MRGSGTPLLAPATSEAVLAGLRAVLSDVDAFSRGLKPGRALRGYQLPLARALAERVAQRGGSDIGMEFAAVFARQSGKDETLAQLLAWLLLREQQRGGSVVVALPSFRPQGLISRDRLVARLDTPLTRRGLVVRDNLVRLGRAEVRFLSAAPGANSRGNTASLLLVANEAQDIAPDTWDAVFAPMAAASNACTLFMGTVWSSDTLLARQMRLLREMERADGVQRVFCVPWQRVAEELPAYGAYVRRQMALLGAEHPFIRTEYELEELDGGGLLFPPARRELLTAPPPEAVDAAPPLVAFTLDVAGEEEADATTQRSGQPNRRRDATALAIWQVRLLPALDAVDAETRGLRAHYTLCGWRVWNGVRHSQLHAQLVALARQYRPQRIVVDATGVGAGLTSFLTATLGARVVQPFVFSSVSKSRLGWDLLGAIDTGRVAVPAPEPLAGAAGDDLAGQRELHALFWRQLAACRYTVLPGPGRLLRWGVEDPLLHDDLVGAFALVAALDSADWRDRTALGRN